MTTGRFNDPRVLGTDPALKRQRVYLRVQGTVQTVFQLPQELTMILWPNRRRLEERQDLINPRPVS